MVRRKESTRRERERSSKNVKAEENIGSISIEGSGKGCECDHRPQIAAVPCPPALFRRINYERWASSVASRDRARYHSRRSVISWWRSRRQDNNAACTVVHIVVANIVVVRWFQSSLYEDTGSRLGMILK